MRHHAHREGIVGWRGPGCAGVAPLGVAEPVEALRPRKDGLRCVAGSSEIRETPEIVVLAVKPQPEKVDRTLCDECRRGA